MEGLTLTSVLSLLGNQFIFPCSLIAGVFASFGKCIWPDGRRLVIPLAGAILILSSVLLRTEFVMFLVASDILALSALLVESIAAVVVMLALIFGQTGWPRATKWFFRPMSIFLVLLVVFQFASGLVGFLLD